MKEVLVLVLVLVSFAFLASENNKSSDITQVVIEIPNLSSPELRDNLQNEFTSLRGVKSCEITILNRTLTLLYDDDKVNKTLIERILLKWGCKPVNYTFNKFIK